MWIYWERQEPVNLDKVTFIDYNGSEHEIYFNNEKGEPITAWCFDTKKEWKKAFKYILKQFYTVKKSHIKAF